MSPSNKLKLDNNQIHQLYIHKNMSMRQIAHIMGCAVGPIANRLKEMGIHKNKQLIYTNINNARKKTFINKYGTEHYMQSKNGLKRYKERLILSTGVDNIAKTELSKNSFNKTYSSRKWMSNPSTQAKRIKTIEKTYGSYNNYKLYLSKLSAKGLKLNNNSKLIYSGIFGNFGVRSKLELNTIKALENITNNLKYEKIIKINNRFRKPDITIKIADVDIMIECKYHRYCKSTPYKSKSWTKKYYNMWHSAQTQLSDLKQWCQNNDYKFIIITEINLKRLSHLIQEVL